MSKGILLKCSEEIVGVPNKIKLLPLGVVKSQKGDFVVDKNSFESMKATFLKRGIDLVVDYEHQTLENMQAPAGGWIKELLLEDNAIQAKVEWTQKAVEYLKNKEYRYLSPVVLVSKLTKKALVLHSVALTNTPAIDNMFAIVNGVSTGEYELEEINEGEKEMDFKKIAQLLGLDENVTEEQILAAIEASKLEMENLKRNCNPTQTVANKVICGLLGVDETSAKTEDIAAAIMALKNPANYVSSAEFKMIKEKLEKKDGEELVLNALKAGKISTAQKEWAQEYALKDFEGFKKFVDKAPKTVPLGEVDLGTTKTVEHYETTMQVCKMLGVSKEDLEKYGKGE